MRGNRILKGPNLSIYFHGVFMNHCRSTQILTCHKKLPHTLGPHGKLISQEISHFFASLRHFCVKTNSIRKFEIFENRKNAWKHFFRDWKRWLSFTNALNLFSNRRKSFFKKIFFGRDVASCHQSLWSEVQIPSSKNCLFCSQTALLILHCYSDDATSYFFYNCS